MLEEEWRELEKAKVVRQKESNAHYIMKTKSRRCGI
jgi:hypothetical protein